MAAIESNRKTSMHIRSNSFPSAHQPLLSQFEEHLNRLKSFESASSSSSVSQRLGGLQDLHDCTDMLLQLSTSQQDFARECSKKLVDRLLVLLDTCSTAKDCLLQSKESIQEVQSILRRRRGAKTDGFAIVGVKYLASRKKMKKAIKKAMVNLKGILKGYFRNEDNETLSIISILKEAEAITMSSLESLLLFICDPTRQLKPRKWLEISRLIQPKRVACDFEESNINEFEKVDAALQFLISLKQSSMEKFQTHSKNLEMCIEDLEVGVERLYRQLIRTRVSLLNLFNH